MCVSNPSGSISIPSVYPDSLYQAARLQQRQPGLMIETLKLHYLQELQRVTAQQKVLQSSLMWLKMLPTASGQKNIKMEVANEQSIVIPDSEVILNPSTSSTASALSSKRSAASSPNAAGSFLCSHPGCGKILKSRFSLRRHISAHAGIKNFVCTFAGCGKRFAESNTLQRHKRIHTGEKPFICETPGCSRAFSDASNWRRHENSHSGAKPFKCPYENCDVRYCRKTTLLNHIQRMHTSR